MKNRLMFVILLVFFSGLRIGLDSFSDSGLPSQTALGPGERKLLAQEEDTSVTSGLEGLSTAEVTPLASSAATDEEEEVIEGAATCGSEFDKTIGVVLFLSGVLYCFVGLAIICEGEFKDSVVEISKFLKLPPDVAGATLMAAGTSSPELFTSLVAVSGPVADIGTGTVVGSAIFNLLIIIGGCVLFSSHTFHLNWKPVLRDSIVNLFSFVFLYLIFLDGYIQWYEAFLGCFFYVMYVAMMAVNTQIMNGMEHTANFFLRVMPFLEYCQDPKDRASNMHVEMSASEPEPDAFSDAEGGTPLPDMLLDEGDLQSEEGEEGDASRNSIQEDAGFDSEKPHEHFHYPGSPLGWVWFVLAWPYELVFHYTIPPVNGRYKYQFLGSFFMSLVWLGVFTTFMVKWTEKIGCILGIEDALMGVTFLAIGTSMPDCLTSIFIARTGRGNMAICNALGSNIFDILLALSLPWALSTVIYQQPVAVYSPTLVQDVVVLTCTLSIFFFTLCLNRWRLNKAIGVFFYVLYAAFVIVTVVREMGWL